MIVATYTEEQILKELTEDYTYVKNTTKKYAAKLIKDVQKRGSFIREDEYHTFNCTTKSNNKWFVSLVLNQKNKIPWRFSACCIIEGMNKTKDYFLVRGLNTPKPYYVKITSHTLKRFKERNNFSKKKFEAPPEEIACHVLMHRETAICHRFMKVKFILLFSKMDDYEESEDMSHIILTNSGIYYGKRSSRGNYVFKTYVSIDMLTKEMIKKKKKKASKWHDEAELVYYMMYAHQYYNKNLYDEDTLEKYLYKEMGRDFEMSDEDKENSILHLLKH